MQSQPHHLPPPRSPSQPQQPASPLPLNSSLPTVSVEPHHSTLTPQPSVPHTPPPPLPLPYLFHHSPDSLSPTTSPPSYPHLHSLLSAFTPTFPTSSPTSLSLSSLFRALDDPYGIPCHLPPGPTSPPCPPAAPFYFLPFLSALHLYSSPSSSPPSTPLFSHTDSLPPHTRYPLPYQIHHLSLHSPAFPSLLALPLSAFDPALSWVALYWAPLLIDTRLEGQMAGHWLSYHRMEVRGRGRGEGARGEGVVRGRKGRGGREEKGREEGEEETEGEEEGELVMAGYVASRVDADWWFRRGEGEGAEGWERGVGVDGGMGGGVLRVTHVDVAADLLEALQGSEAMQPDFTFAVSQPHGHHKGR